MAWEVTPPDPNYAVRIQHANPAGAAGGGTPQCDDFSELAGLYEDALTPPATNARQVTVDVRTIPSITNGIDDARLGYVCYLVAPASDFSARATLRVSPADFMPADNGTAATDEAVLPRLLHRFNNGIFRRIQQRQREDGRWK